MARIAAAVFVILLCGCDLVWLDLSGLSDSSDELALPALSEVEGSDSEGSDWSDPAPCDDGNDEPWDGCNQGQVAEFQANVTTAGSQRAAAVVAWPGLQFAVLWGAADQDGDQGGVFGRTFDADGWPVGGEYQVNQSGTGDQSQAVACSWPDGVFLAAWTDLDVQTGDADIAARLLLKDGTPMTDELVVNPPDPSAQDRPAAACFDDGSFVVAWTSDSPGEEGLDVFARRFAADGSPSPVIVALNTWTDAAQFEPSVAPLPDGGYAAVWTSFGQDGDLEGVYGRVIDSADQPAGPEFQVHEVWQKFQVDQRVAAFPDGRFVVVWQRETDDVLQGEVQARYFDGAGKPLSGEIEVNTAEIYCQDHPAVATFPDGSFIVSYRSFDLDGSSWASGVQRIDAAGAKSGSELTANTFTTGNQWYPRIAAFPDGSYVVAWSSFGQDGDNFGVFAQRFSSDGTRKYR